MASYKRHEQLLLKYLETHLSLKMLTVNAFKNAQFTVRYVMCATKTAEITNNLHLSSVIAKLGLFFLS